MYLSPPKRLLLACFIFFIIPVGNNLGICQADPVPEILSNQDKIVIGGSFDYPPYSYLDKDGNPAGLSVELSQAIAREMNKELEFKLQKWSEVRSSLENGEVDAVHDMFSSEEREASYDFSSSYNITSYTVFTKDKGPSIHTIEDLNEKTVIVVRGDIGHDYVTKQHLNARVKIAETYETALLLLNNDNYDCALMEKLPGLYWMKTQELKNVTASHINIFPVHLCYAVMEGNQQLLFQINEALAVLKQTGEYDHIYNKWIGILDPAAVSPAQVVKYAAYILIPLILILSLSLLWLWSLRRQVNKKTRQLQNEILQRADAEQALQKLNADLEFRVAERTRQLTIANQELESFSYSVSHDLRAPLRSLTGFSQALQEDYENELDDQALDYLNRINSAAKNMGELIDVLLTLSRLTRQEMTMEKVNLSNLVADTVKALQADKPDRVVNIICPENIEVYGDKRLLKIAVKNLLENSWKYTAYKSSAIVEFGVTSRDNKKVYFIRDNGAGFDMKYVNKLFTPFQRLHSSFEFSGSGIGLSIVQRVISRHHGSVWAEGKVDQGAVFYFTLWDDFYINNTESL